MALLFCDSFDHYSFGQMSKKWSAVNTISASGIITGRNVSGVGPGPFEIYKTIPGGLRSSLTIGAFRRCGALGVFPQIIVGNDALPNGSFAVSDYGNAQVVAHNNAIGATSTAVTHQPDVGHYCEVQINCAGALGSGSVRVDGVEVVPSTTINTGIDGGASRLTQTASIKGVGAGIGTMFDDFYTSTTFLGDVKVKALYPDAVGNYSQFTPTGSATNYQNVDETLADEADYNSTATVGFVDTFGYQAVGLTGTVHGVQLCVLAAGSSLGIRGVCRIGGVDYLSTNTETTSGTSKFHLFIWDTNPATGVAWTTADIDGAEFGYKYESGGGTTLTVYQAVVEVVITASSLATVSQAHLEAVGYDTSTAVVSQAHLELLQELEPCSCPGENVMY